MCAIHDVENKFYSILCLMQNHAFLKKIFATKEEKLFFLVCQKYYGIKTTTTFLKTAA
jgi:hypothetical protein